MTGLSIALIALVAAGASVVTCAPWNWTGDVNNTTATQFTEPGVFENATDELAFKDLLETRSGGEGFLNSTSNSTDLNSHTQDVSSDKEESLFNDIDGDPMNILNVTAIKLLQNAKKDPESDALDSRPTIINDSSIPRNNRTSVTSEDGQDPSSIDVSTMEPGISGLFQDDDINIKDQSFQVSGQSVNKNRQSHLTDSEDRPAKGLDDIDLRSHSVIENVDTPVGNGSVARTSGENDGVVRGNGSEQAGRTGSGDGRSKAGVAGKEAKPSPEDYIEENYGVGDLGPRGTELSGSMHELLSVTSEGSSDPMELSDDVIIDALFTNLDIIQDNIEMCEEGLRNQLVQLSRETGPETYSVEEASDIMSFGDDPNPNERAAQPSDEDVDNVFDDEDEDDEEDEEEDDDDLNLHHDDFPPEKRPSPSSQYSSVANKLSKDSEHASLPPSDSHSTTPEKSSLHSEKPDPGQTARKRRSTSENSSGRQAGSKAEVTKQDVLDRQSLGHDVISRLSSRLHYLKTSLEECYILYRRMRHDARTTQAHKREHVLV